MQDAEHEIAGGVPALADPRPPRLAVMSLKGLDHFLPDLLHGLASRPVLDARSFTYDGPASLAAALAWADDPAQDAIWFEFCWPPFPQVIANTDFGGRRVLVRVHRIEAYETLHVAEAPWHKVDDCITVSDDMARLILRVAPAMERRTRLHVLHNGVDLARFAPAATPPDPFRIGWCGSMITRKNPTLALEILARLLGTDPRWRLHLATGSGEPMTEDAVVRLVGRMGLGGAVHFDGAVPAAEMPAWHARNAVLLSTSLHESFGYAIAEAAAVGCDVAVLDHRGAEEFWPEEIRFGTVDEAVGMIANARPMRWRALIEARFGLDRQVDRLLSLLADQSPPTPRERLVPIAHGGWHGCFPVREPADHIQYRILASGGFYEPDLLEDLRRRLPPNGLFVDIGANIGNHSLFAAGVCGARVLAFEPSPPIAAHWSATIAANGLSGRADLRRAGLGATEGTAWLAPGPAGNAGMTRIVPDERGSVPVLRLDDTLTEQPHVLKIDVEGMEPAVLAGAREVLQRYRPAIYVETLTEAAYAEVDALLRPYGYRPKGCFNRHTTWLFVAQAA